MAPPHRPVMAAEVLEALKPVSGGFYIDGTLGAGGHAAAILTASDPGGRLLGLDRDPKALELAQTRLQEFKDRIHLVQDSFDQAGQWLAPLAPQGADGMLLDLGVSSMQLDQGERGFSFRMDAPLDMRMGPGGISAAELLAKSSRDELRRLFSRYGEEPFAGRIAKTLVQARSEKPITTTGQLAALVEAAVPAAARRKQKLHPATRVFQALRIEVNDEMGRLERFLENSPAWLKPGGVLAIISYHSLEDRRVKKAFNKMANPCTCPPQLPVCACGKKPLFSLGTKRPLTPSPEEVAANPRARSAKLRFARRTGEAVP